jgi:hypothetical protein
MRPSSIVWFEAFYLASLPVAALNMLAGWDRMAAMLSPVWAAAVFAGSLALAATLVLLVSRRANRLAKWILVGLLAYGLIVMILAYIGLVELMNLGWNELVVWIAQGAATSLLLTPSARDWMRRRNDPAADPDSLERTFE